jgi:hypothetical protein
MDFSGSRPKAPVPIIGSIRNELSAGNKSGVYIAVLQGIEKLFGSKPIDVDRLLVSPGAIILMERAKA